MKPNMKNRKNYIRMRHYGEIDKHVNPNPKDPDGKTLCGRNIRSRFRHLATLNKNLVTCPHCIEEMRLYYWHCEEHGFIPDTEVENDETCETCGRPVSSENA